ncbi:PH domain-containing protein [Halococcus saccharolyticus]|uniref:YokE-like PH domain-containing protein n=1 Tax=Halococcus saccharolyticus DSM 5350 TaxID=1227455 RepID=M0MQK6_9EURY|nr:PH domain-containing protein [Halococcus saccharolyticus]EMA47992.1 hypothetical protein C449_00930 [Halococcus saccharolyticus DSM 5350]
MEEVASVDELPQKLRNRLEGLLRNDESFILALHNTGLVSKLNSLVFAVTDRRFIVLNKSPFNEKLSEIRMANLSRVEYESKYSLGKLVLEGSGVDEEYQIERGDARILADAIRAQLDHPKEAV